MVMRHYIQNLRTVSEKRLTEHRLDKRISWTGGEPIEAQIHRWWVNLPPAVRERKFQIVEIASQCTGKYRPKPALRQVTAALRSSGWQEVRDWTNLGRNCRLWRPPKSFESV